MTTPPEHSSGTHLRPQRHLNMTLDHMIPPSKHCFFDLFSAVFLLVWWLSSLSFTFENYCTKGLLELNTHSQPKVSVLFSFVHVCQLNVITDPTALIFIWYLIGRFASSIWRCCSNYFKTLVFSFISFVALGVKLQSKAVFKEVPVC